MIFFSKIRGALPLLFFLILVIHSVQAAPPFQTSPTLGGCEISPIVRETLTAGQDFDFNFHTFNITNGYPLSNTSLSCYFHFYNQTGDHVFAVILKNDPISEHLVPNEWAMRMKGGNISTSGTYAYLVQCNGTISVGGCADKGTFTVTPKVITTSATSDWRIFIILTLLAMALLVFSLYSKNHIFAFFTGLVFSLAGVYSMIYGFDNVTDLYTRAIGLILLGIGGILAALSVFDLIKENYGGENNDDEED